MIAALVASGSAMASTTTFNFANQANSTGNSYGDTLSLVSGSLTITETAWWLSTTSPTASTTFQQAAVDSYNGYGLGVCDPDEGTNCGSPQHQITNNEGIDFVLLVFSAPVSLQDLTANLTLLHYADLSPNGTENASITYWTPSSAITTSTTYGSLGTGTNVNNGCDPAPCSVTDTVTSSDASITELLIAAQVGGGGIDAFKLASLTTENYIKPTPEPASWAMLGSGLLVGVALLRRRRKNELQ